MHSHRYFKTFHGENNHHGMSEMIKRTIYRRYQVKSTHVCQSLSCFVAFSLCVVQVFAISELVNIGSIPPRYPGGKMPGKTCHHHST